MTGYGIIIEVTGFTLSPDLEFKQRIHNIPGTREEPTQNKYTGYNRVVFVRGTQIEKKLK